jgi:general secretion pathway protein H
MSLRRPAGFTLIEVMVVIVIIGVMATMIVVSVTLGDPQRELRTEAERLRTVLALAAEEAVIQQVELGAEFTESGYRFLKWEMAATDTGTGSSFSNNPGLSSGTASQPSQKINPQTGEPMEPEAEWVVLGGDEILREYELPEGMRMLVEVDFEAVDIQYKPEEKSNIKVEEKLVPTLLFLSSGETSPFRIEMFSEKGDGKPVYIEGSVIGQVGVVDELPR